LRELVPRRLAEELRARGFYVSRHANWLIVMKDERIAALVYVYPLYSEAEVVDLGSGEEVERALLKVAPEFKVRRRRALHLKEGEEGALR